VSSDSTFYSIGTFAFIRAAVALSPTVKDAGSDLKAWTPGDHENLHLECRTGGHPQKFFLDYSWNALLCPVISQTPEHLDMPRHSLAS
jgi:hypothetical protein